MLESESSEEVVELPKIDKVFTLTEEKRVVKDGSTDFFLKTLSEDSVRDHKILKSLQDKIFEKGFTDESGKIGSKQYVEGENNMTMYGALDCVEPPYNQSFLAKLYETNGIHAASVDAKIDNISGFGYYWDYSRKAEKIRQRAAKKDDDKRNAVESSLIDDKGTLDDAINKMNKFDNFDEILEKVLKDRFTTGNGYFEIGRNDDGIISFIGHIPSIHMRVRRTRDGFVQYAGDKPIFFRNLGDKKTKDPFGNDPKPNEIIHYKKYSPTNNYYGVPEIISATDNLAGVEFANKYNIEYFEHKAVPRYIITTKGVVVTEKVHSELLRFFETTTAGKSHRSIMIPMPNPNAEIEFVPVETKKQEASFTEYIDQNVKLILARHRVPPNRLGMGAGTGIGDSRDANKIFKESVCGPEQRTLEKKLAKVFRELTDLFVFKLHEYTLTDENEKSQIHERYARMGIIVPDEARTEIDLGPRPDGRGDEPVDAKSMAEAQIDAAAELQTAQLASAEKTARANAAATKAAAAAKPATAAKAPAKTANPAGKAAAAQKATANQSRTRDANRSANKTDGTGATQSRNAKGTGRKQA